MISKKNKYNTLKNITICFLRFNHVSWSQHCRQLPRLRKKDDNTAFGRWSRLCALFGEADLGNGSQFQLRATPGDWITWSSSANISMTWEFLGLWVCVSLKVDLNTPFFTLETGDAWAPDAKIIQDQHFRQHSWESSKVWPFSLLTV